MSSELSQAIQQVCDDKKIPVESVISTIESALAAAYRKDFGDKTQNVKVEFNMDTGGFKVFDVKEVVEDELKEIYEKLKEEKMKAAEEGVEWKPEQKEAEMEQGEEEVKKFNPKTMISLSDAKEEKKSIKLGEELIKELEVPGDFGRMAAQTAKQVIIQKLREAERDTIFHEYSDKQGELINGTVQRREGGVWLVELGNVTAVMPITESIRGENYTAGRTFKFYVKSVEQTAKGPEVVLSRTTPEILRKLFKLEVPEIASGTVQIKSIAREAGSRSKIAVMAKEENIDPIGSCVGQRGTRVQTIINELGGEKIDIIEWDKNQTKFIAKALSPAKVLNVETKDHESIKTDGLRPKRGVGQHKNKEGAPTDEEVKTDTEKKEEESKEGDTYSGREAIVTVNEDQLSLAIGKEGQNVRLAAKLTGWKIDIIAAKAEGEGEEDEVKGKTEEAELDSKDSAGEPETEEITEKIEQEVREEIKEEKEEKEEIKSDSKDNAGDVKAEKTPEETKGEVKKKEQKKEEGDK